MANLPETTRVWVQDDEDRGEVRQASYHPEKKAVRLIVYNVKTRQIRWAGSYWRKGADAQTFLAGIADGLKKGLWREISADDALIPPGRKKGSVRAKAGAAQKPEARSSDELKAGSFDKLRAGKLRVRTALRGRLR